MNKAMREAVNRAMRHGWRILTMARRRVRLIIGGEGGGRKVRIISVLSDGVVEAN